MIYGIRCTAYGRFMGYRVFLRGFLPYIHYLIPYTVHRSVSVAMVKNETRPIYFDLMEVKKFLLYGLKMIYKGL